MGASGMYSMSFVIIPEIVPLRLFGQFSAVMGAVFAVSSILGPILGGIVVNSSSWRWVFLLK
jgi:MFS family permease